MGDAHVNTEARREAIAIGGCPFRAAEDIIREGAVAEAAGQAALHELAAEQKPEIYAHFKIYIEDTLQGFFERQTANDTLGLLTAERNGNKLNFRDAEWQDINTWDGLRDCWISTLDYEMAYTEFRWQNTSIFKATDALWSVRRRAGKLKRDTITQLRAGILTVSTSTAELGYGMSLFLESENVTGEAKKAAMRRSHGPLRDLADLEIHQMDTFGRTYLGEYISGPSDDTTVDTHYEEIDAGLYTLFNEPQQRLAYIQKPETLPASNGQLISEVKPSLDGPRMGCPIRLSPQLTQRLWGVYVDSAAAVGLLDGNPAQYIKRQNS